MESKMINILIILVVFAVLVYAVFYTFGSPLKEKIKNISCDLLQDKIFELKSCEKGPTIEEIQKQIQQVELQNAQNLVGAMKYKFESCGKNDQIDKCRCTLSFGSIGENTLVITQLKDKIGMKIPSGQNIELNYQDLYYDDGTHNLLDQNKLEEGDQIIFTRQKAQYFYNFERFYIKLKKKGQSVQDAKDISPPLKSLNSKELSEYADAIGLFKDGNKIGIYIPKVGTHWIFGDWERKPLDECKH